MAENEIVMVPLAWLDQDERQRLIRNGYEIIPIPGYQETHGFRAFKIIGPYSQDNMLMCYFSIPIWEDWKLTAKYACRAERVNSTTGIQMFDHLDDDEKNVALKYNWLFSTKHYIVKYFQIILNFEICLNERFTKYF